MIFCVVCRNILKRWKTYHSRIIMQETQTMHCRPSSSFMTVHDTHSCSQHRLCAGTDEWVLSWRLNEESDSCGYRRAVGSQFQVLEPYAAKLRWPVDVRVQGTRRASETAERDWRRPSVDAHRGRPGNVALRRADASIPAPPSSRALADELEANEVSPAVW